MGAMGGALLGMGLYSYSPMRKSHFPAVKRKLADIGTIKSVKVTNISETSWFENAVLMGDIKAAGGLLVNQYTYNWPPFGDGSGLGKGSFERGLAKIKHLLPHDLDAAWAVTEKLSVSPKNAKVLVQDNVGGSPGFPTVSSTGHFNVSRVWGSYWVNATLTGYKNCSEFVTVFPGQTNASKIISPRSAKVMITDRLPVWAMIIAPRSAIVSFHRLWSRRPMTRDRSSKLWTVLRSDGTTIVECSKSA